MKNIKQQEQQEQQVEFQYKQAETQISSSYIQMSPITTLPIVLAGDINSIIDVPITIKNFNKISAISLIFYYDSNVLEYVDFENTSQYPGLGCGYTINGKIVIGGFGTETTLDNDSVLCNIKFLFKGGYTDLTWDSNNPISCEYVGSGMVVLPDNPFEDYYYNGKVEETPPYVTLNGIVYPNGVDTEVFFDLRPENLEVYNKITKFGNVNGFDNVNCSVRLKIESNITYLYRIRAINVYGVSYGDEVTFTTPGPPIANTLPATNLQ